MSNKKRDKSNKEKDKDEGRIADNVEAITIICVTLSALGWGLWVYLHPQPLDQVCRDKGLIPQQVGVMKSKYVVWKVMCRDKQGNYLVPTK